MKFKFFAVPAIATLIFAGCATPPPESPPPVMAEPPPPPYMPRVNTVSDAQPKAKISSVLAKQVITDGTYANRIVVEEVRESKTKEGFRRIQVFVKSHVNIPIATLYRFDWTDEDGEVVVDPYHDSWEKKIVLAGDDVVFTSIAPKKTCKDFKLRLRAIDKQ